MDRTQKAALFVFLVLVAGLATGFGLYLSFTDVDRDAVVLLALCVLVAFGLIVVTVRVVHGINRSKRRSLEYGVPESRFLNLLSLRQWLLMLVGLTVITIGTGSLTGVRVLAGGDEPPPPVLPGPTSVATVVPAAPVPPTADPTLSPTVDRTTDAPSADPFPTESASDAPRPGATTYLDSQDETAGRASAGAATFSDQRYPRSISFWCSRATSSYVQWNVAGSATFTATAGIDDGTQGAFGLAAEMIFYNEDGRQLVPKPIDVSVGHPRKVEIDLTGVVSLRMTCSGRVMKTNDQASVYTTLGDALIIRG
ncbi:hypothetical protein [Asanoa siamensis]|uniref:NPCBM/NEW2 domain-containing protein n=1 Tax=Asanoa siamensis TaxID=926357 RepID=A0ABQ4CRN9_9ACTN|nr:hypothetical protein [Asanoa siamensis]GIF73926.1 hypothetical protein Asi02nite_34440 [Asanoa siamensis]